MDIRQVQQRDGGVTLPESLMDHLHTVHKVVASHCPKVHRIALAPYDAPTDMLHTFASSNTDGVALERYGATLHSVPSLLELATRRQSRVVSNIEVSFPSDTPHTNWIKGRNYRSSFTVPIFQKDQLSAFLFFDSKEADAFDSETVAFLEAFSDLLSQVYLLQMDMMAGISRSVQLVSGLARIRDLETGEHLERMGAYARLIAMGVAERWGLGDESIEYIYQFARLHDIGKVGIPDRVLLKPGKLDDEEWAIMRRHVEIGERIIDEMWRGISIGNALANRILCNIVAGHHERGDGSGYPRGLTMEQIAPEARIVAVADVYDALSNRRPYKKPWSEEEVAAELRKESAAGRLDGDCVEALLNAREEREAILQRYSDTQTATEQPA